MNELNERIELLMSENGLLIEQKMTFSDELDKNMQELSNRTMELNSMSEEFLNIQSEYTASVHTISLVQQERDVAVSKIMEYADINGKIESQIDNFKTELTIWQQKSSNAEKMNIDLKSKMKGLIIHHEEDGQIFFKRTKNAEDRVVELHTQLLQKSSEFDDLQETYRKTQREYSSTRSDAEGKCSVCCV